MDVTIHTGDHELSLAEFLDGCAKVVNGDMTSEVVRSSLEDFNTEAIDVTDSKQKTPTFPKVPSVKHGNLFFFFLHWFACMMTQIHNSHIQQ